MVHRQGIYYTFHYAYTHNHTLLASLVRGDRNPGFFNKLFWGFIHTKNRILGIKWALINIQNHFHICNKATVLFRGNYPSFPLPGFDFVFLKYDVLFREKYPRNSQVLQPYRLTISKTILQNLQVVDCN